METPGTQPKRRGRRGLKWFWAAVVAAVVLVVLVSFFRVGVASFLVRRALDRQGFADATFRLTRLSPGCVAVEDFRLGTPEPVLAVDRLEARFSLLELLRGQLERLRICGVRVPLVVADGRIVSPLQERLSQVLSASGDASSAKGRKGEVRAAAGEVSVYDIRIPLRLAGGAEVLSLRGDVSLVAEPGDKGVDAMPERYRLWAVVRDTNGLLGTLSGTVAPLTGTLQLAAEMKVKSVEGLVERVRLAVPERVDRLPVFPTHCAFSLRGSLALSDWTNAGPFELTAELGRGSAFTLKQTDGVIRLQTLRVEASGTPQDVQSRLSVGIGGFRIGGQIQASQEEGRLLSMRGTARFRQTATNRVVRATLDSDLPGKSVAQVLPKVLPLLPRLLTEGGTLHAEAELEQPRAGAWQGQVRYAAEARRNTLTMPAGRVGAACVAIEGDLCVRDASPDDLKIDIRVEDGFFFRPGLSARGGGVMSLRSEPPYRSASGTFEGKINETAALPKSGLELPADGIHFGGKASVAGLVTNPVWEVALEVPEFAVTSRPPVAACQAMAGGAAQIRYSATQISMDGNVRARDAVASVVGSGKVGRVEAGLGRFSAHVGIAHADPSDFSNAEVRVALSASNGWCRAGGGQVVLEGAEAFVPIDWSVSRGVVFCGDPRLSWTRLESDGLKLLPGVLTLGTENGAAVAGFGVKVEGSRFGATARARVPFSDPRLCEIDVTLPETELDAEDALAARVKRVDPAVSVTGLLGAEARVRFLGSQPHVVGRMRVSGGKLSRDRLEIGGLGADVAFEAGLGFRTIERPVVTFTSAHAGNIRLDKGRVEFQVTPEELFVDRFEVGWCKGNLNAYSVHLDPRNPKADVIVYADRIDLGEALMMVMPFKGKMEGVLYGRFPVGIDGSRVKLSTGYLYSLPGQGGVLRLEDPAQMMSLLGRAGIMGDVQQPLSKALSDMDFSTIRMELEPKAEGDAVFRIKLDGKSNFKEWPAPVALNLNLHGPLEELLNLGLSVSRK